MNRDIIPFNLDDLTGIAGKVTLKGTVHDVLPLNGKAFHTVQRLLKKGTEKIDLEHLSELWTVCHQLIPTLSQEQVDELTSAQVMKIITIASATIEAVEQTNPK